MSASSLELRGIRKSFPGPSTPHVVLDGIDLTLMRGEDELAGFHDGESGERARLIT